MNKRNIVIIGSMGIIAIGLWVTTYAFPLSSFSMNKSYTFKADEGYTDNFNDYRDLLLESVNNSKEDATKLRTNNIIDMYNQDWLTGKESSISVTKGQLENWSLTLENVHSQLVSLTYDVAYSNEEINHLQNVIDSIVTLHNKVQDIESKEFISRGELADKLASLQAQYTHSIKDYSTFYKYHKDNNKGVTSNE